MATIETQIAMSEEDIRKYHEMGLGRGVNVTDADMWRNKSSFIVRKIACDPDLNIMTTNECGMKEAYVKEVSSFETMQQAIQLSLDEPTSKFKIGMDTQCSQSETFLTRIAGEKIETRTISFVSDFHDIPMYTTKHTLSLEVPPNIESSDSTFERNLCSWILQCIQDRQKTENPGVSIFDQQKKPIKELTLVLKRLLVVNRKQVLTNLLLDCKKFLTSLGITHYVSSITLGAMSYSSHTIKTKQKAVKGGVEVGVNGPASGGISGSFAKAKEWILNEHHKKTIGRMNVDENPSGEAVIGFQIQPIDVLVHSQFLDWTLRRAIKEYIQLKRDKAEGPFMISCKLGKEPVYWIVTETSEEKHIVRGTTSAKEASYFYIKLGENPSQPCDFFIMYYGENELDRKILMHLADSHVRERRYESLLPRYVASQTRSRIFGDSEKPLELKMSVEASEAQFSLHDRVQSSFACFMCRSTPVSMSSWLEGEQFYIKCSQHSLKMDGFIAMRKITLLETTEKAGPEQQQNEIETTIVLGRKDESDPGIGMLFRLHPKDFKKLLQDNETQEPALTETQQLQTNKQQPFPVQQPNVTAPGDHQHSKQPHPSVRNKPPTQEPHVNVNTEQQPFLDSEAEQPTENKTEVPRDQQNSCSIDLNGTEDKSLPQSEIESGTSEQPPIIEPHSELEIDLQSVEQCINVHQPSKVEQPTKSEPAVSEDQKHPNEARPIDKSLSLPETLECEISEPGSDTEEIKMDLLPALKEPGVSETPVPGGQQQSTFSANDTEKNSPPSLERLKPEKSKAITELISKRKSEPAVSEDQKHPNEARPIDKSLSLPETLKCEICEPGSEQFEPLVKEPGVGDMPGDHQQSTKHCPLDPKDPDDKSLSKTLESNTTDQPPIISLHSNTVQVEIDLKRVEGLVEDQQQLTRSDNCPEENSSPLSETLKFEKSKNTELVSEEQQPSKESNEPHTNEQQPLSGSEAEQTSENKTDMPQDKQNSHPIDREDKSLPLSEIKSGISENNEQTHLGSDDTVELEIDHEPVKPHINEQQPSSDREVEQPTERETAVLPPPSSLISQVDVPDPPQLPPPPCLVPQADVPDLPQLPPPPCLVPQADVPDPPQLPPPPSLDPQAAAIPILPILLPTFTCSRGPKVENANEVYDFVFISVRKMCVSSYTGKLSSNSDLEKSSRSPTLAAIPLPPPLPAALLDMPKQDIPSVSVSTDSVLPSPPIAAFGPGLEISEVNSFGYFQISCPQNITTDDLAITIEGPNGNIPVEIYEHVNSQFSCSYQPTQAGSHVVSIKVNDKHIPSSPFTAHVVQFAQYTDKLKAEGTGLVSGTTTEPCHFTIEMKTNDVTDNAKFGIQIVGPASTEPIKIVKDAQKCFIVTYHPSTPGIYTVRVLWNQFNVEGSPFTSHITVPVTKDYANLTCNTEATGEGLKEGNVNEPIEVFVKTGAGPGPLTVRTIGPSKPSVTGDVTKKGFKLTIICQDPGEYKLILYWGNDEVPGSPYTVQVEGEGKASRPELCTASGPGLLSGVVGDAVKFTVDIPNKARPGHLGVSIVGPHPPQPIEIANLSGSTTVSEVTYHPIAPGDYKISVLWAEKHIPGSPFTAVVPGIAIQNAKEVYASGEIIHSGEMMCNQLGTITVSPKTTAGPGPLRATLSGPSKPTDLTIMRNSDGTKVVSFTPKCAGDYELHLLWGDGEEEWNEINGSPFTIKVS